MNKTLLLLLLLPVFVCAKRDPCKKIKRVYNSEKRSRGYESPALEHITIMKQYKPSTYFVVRFCLRDPHEHYERTGIDVEFEDGTVLKSEDASVACQQEPSSITGGYFSSGSHSGEYVLQGFFYITEENIAKFTSKKIKRVYLADVSANIMKKEAGDVLTYVNCMKDMNGTAK